MVAAAVIGGAVIGAGATAYSGKKAAEATEKAAQKASNTELEMYYQTREDLAPYRETGTAALSKLGALYGIGDQTEEDAGTRAPDYSDFYESPDYQFTFDQGTRAVEQSLAKRGLGGAADSGAAMKSLTRFGQGLASQQFSNYRNSLAALAGIGQTATTTGASFGASTSSAVGRNIMAAGDARASSYLNTGAAVSNVADSAAQYQLLKAGGYIN